MGWGWGYGGAGVGWGGTRCQNNNIPALVQIMAWCRPGNKPLSEPMLVNLLTHICGTWPHWVNTGASFTKRYNLNQHRSGIKAWRSNYIYWSFGMYECLHPQETVDVITYPWHNLSQPRSVRDTSWFSHIYRCYLYDCPVQLSLYDRPSACAVFLTDLLWNHHKLLWRYSVFHTPYVKLFFLLSTEYTFNDCTIHQGSISYIYI